MSTVRAAKSLKLNGGPDRDRTGDLFHAMKCKSPELLKLNNL